MTREVLKMALEALEKYRMGTSILNDGPDASDVDHAKGLILKSMDLTLLAIPAIKAALAKQEAESHLQAVSDFGQLQEQEPVAWQWLDTATFRKKIPPTGESECWNPLYTSPPKRQPLTEDQIEAVMNVCLNDWAWQAFARANEAAHDIGDKT